MQPDKTTQPCDVQVKIIIIQIGKVTIKPQGKHEVIPLGLHNQILFTAPIDNASNRSSDFG